MSDESATRPGTGSADTDLGAFLHALPKTETHLHLEGSLAFGLARRRDPRVTAPSGRGVGYKYPDFAAFDRELLGIALPWFTSAEAYHRAAALTFGRLVAENVRYVETSFHAGVVAFAAVPAGEIIAAIRAAAPASLVVRVFTGVTRDFDEPPCGRLLAGLPAWPGLDGIDLHGDESLPLRPWTAGLWREAATAGLELKAHAGEFGPASNVRQAVEELGVRRVQHGIRAIDDPDVVRLLVETGTVLDTCPTSNVRLAPGVASIADHPLRSLRASGVRCTVSTDDPLVFGHWLTDEYAALAGEGGFTRAELADVARQGFLAGRMPEAVRAAALASIDALAEAR